MLHVRMLFTPPSEVAFTNTNTNTISGVLCISDTSVYIIFGQAELYRLFGFKFAVTIIQIHFTCITVASRCLCLLSLCMPGVYCKCMCIRMKYNMCAFVY